MDLNERRQLPLFSIGTVQKLTGLSARQIRYYEEQGLISPIRSEGKQRQFSFVDVERLMRIREWMEDGESLSGVKRRLLDPRFGKAVVSSDLSDEQVYEQLQRELLKGSSAGLQALFQGDLSRFYRRKS
ncbi:MAG: MerR family transcriptional regulator [Alicyclobacillaceae bacterium]|jgi:MerR family glutamine synthetase transcriptional repressor|uniref:MerR family transcriptional regulator n=1 Tax=Alicyclobacillus sp. SP_1 TaxID=2942475 RepID=UPI002157FF20|nr:MerR family transcriptional regulator [Alicyclobacillus sp. SP_1]MCY0889172.1 MerR family transcriptional regulator [Alicyclobacillaceae bacterium]MCY0896966.1 MerR family transcriptional regulator [Alicyclobacillaceae bacterium]